MSLGKELDWQEPDLSEHTKIFSRKQQKQNPDSF